MDINLRRIAVKILSAAVHDSLHSTRIERRAELLSFISDSAWFSTICAAAGIKREDELKRYIRKNVIRQGSAVKA